MRQVFIIAIFLLVLDRAYSQNFEIGGEIGYGQTYFDSHLSIPVLFSKYSGRNAIIGITASYKPKKAMFLINSGIIFQHKSLNGDLLNFFKLPLGIDIAPGNKFRFLIGGGFFFGWCFSATTSKYSEVSQSRSDFQFGAYINSGFRYQITRSIVIFTKLQIDADLTALYKEVHYNHFGPPDYSDGHSYDYSVNLGVKYIIISKKKNK